MSQSFPPTHPLPATNGFTQPFWEACQQRRLTFSTCRQCGHRFLPGAPVCPQCWSGEIAASTASGTGQVFSFAIYRRTYHPAIPAPYIIALIELDEGPRLVSNIEDCPFDQVAVGLRVQVRFDSVQGFLLPRFVPLGRRSSV
ncbi:MAG: OB-fold domain-containing protein [Pseudomonadales bacterium]|nr:OB-fold domain-containing protein [Pseudomonadales bacterium]